MKTKTIAFGLFALLSLFLIAGMASALSLSSPQLLTLSDNATTISLTNTHNASQNIALSISDNETGIVFAVSPTSISNLENGTSQDVTVSISSIADDLELGEYTATLTATGDATSTTKEITFVKGFCEAGEVGRNVRINEVEIESDGDEDDEWKLLDTITIDVEVENYDSEEIDDVIVELGLFDSSGKNVADDLEFLNEDEEKFDLGDIEDGDDATAYFEFVVPADFDDGDYKVAVKVYSEDLEEENECSDVVSDFSNDYFTEVSIDREDDEGYFISFDDVELSESTVTCGDSVTLTFDIYNIGDEDLEDRVRVNVKSVSLDLDVSEEITKDLDQGDKASFEFTFKVPEGTDVKTHEISLWADYDYDDGDYDETSEEVENVELEVIGCTPQITTLATISAELVSEEVKAGEELVIKATIVNPNEDTISYVIGAKNYDSWAELISVSDQILTVEGGESEEVTFTFEVEKDASEEESFTIEVISGDDTEERDVKVNIKDSSMFGLLGDNSLILVIGAVNLVLIILIILVAVKMSRG